jgi:hypothetical protein
MTAPPSARMRSSSACAPGTPPSGAHAEGSSPADPASALRRGARLFFAVFAAGLVLAMAADVADRTALAKPAPFTWPRTRLGERLGAVVTRAFVALAAEFPNDNSELHEGTIWMCVDLCGPAEAHLPAPEVLPAEVEAEDAFEPIEIVESIDFDGPIELVPAPLESGEILATHAAELDEPAEEEQGPAPLISTTPPPIDDPYDAFLQTLSDVACDSGRLFAASEIGAAFAGDAVALAWRAILRGESEDFSLCSTPLDEWASLALAQFLSAPHTAAQLRRELRARGVAAFGLVEAAA